jgi:hypothetical protein
MIAKITKGQDFRGVVNYVLDKSKNAELLDSQGIRIKSADSISQSFSFQSKMNTRIKKPVGHISLNFSAQDKNKLTNKNFVKISKDYLMKMGISDTQYIISRHHDREHPHVHIVFNRVGNNGKTITDSNDRFRSEKICKELTKNYGLYFAEGKEKVKIQRLREPDKTRYEIYESLKNTVCKCQNWDQIITKLKGQNIEVSFKFKGNSSLVQGVTFSKNGYTFNGSKVDRMFSFSKITNQLEQNFYQNRNHEIGFHSQIQNQNIAGNILTNFPIAI